MAAKKKTATKTARHKWKWRNSDPWGGTCLVCGLKAWAKRNHSTFTLGTTQYTGKDGTEYGPTMPACGLDPYSLTPWQREALANGWRSPVGWAPGKAATR